jgi:hypothetical protein
MFSQTVLKITKPIVSMKRIYSDEFEKMLYNCAPPPLVSGATALMIFSPKPALKLVHWLLHGSGKVLPDCWNKLLHLMLDHSSSASSIA